MSSTPDTPHISVSHTTVNKGCLSGCGTAVIGAILLLIVLPAVFLVGGLAWNGLTG